jgi:hypothetical protein
MHHHRNLHQHQRAMTSPSPPPIIAQHYQHSVGGNLMTLSSLSNNPMTAALPPRLVGKQAPKSGNPDRKIHVLCTQHDGILSGSHPRAGCGKLTGVRMSSPRTRMVISRASKNNPLRPPPSPAHLCIDGSAFTALVNRHNLYPSVSRTDENSFTRRVLLHPSTPLLQCVKMVNPGTGCNGCERRRD